MFSNDLILEDNQNNNFCYWDMDQNSIFSTNKDDLPFNIFDSPVKSNQFYISEGTAETSAKCGEDKHTSELEETNKRGRKIFKVKKYVEYDEILKEIYTENEATHDEIQKTKNKLLARKRFTLRKKEENFSKLSQKEKVEKLGKLSKLVKRYRRKYTCLQTKIKNNITKIFQKYLYEKLKINYKNKYLNHNLNLDLFQLVKTLRRLHSCNSFEYTDQKNALETIINLIAENKLPFDSLAFKMICTQIRLFLNKDKIRYVNKKGSQITIQFPEREIKISKKEYDCFQTYINSNEVLRKIFGLEKPGQQQMLNMGSHGNGNIQLIPVITLPMINLSDLVKKGAPSFFLLGQGNNNTNNNCNNTCNNNCNSNGNSINNGFIGGEDESTVVSFNLSNKDKFKEDFSEREQIEDHDQNSLLNTYFLINGEGRQ